MKYEERNQSEGLQGQRNQRDRQDWLSQHNRSCRDSLGEQGRQGQLMKQYDIVISAEEARSLVDDIYVFLAMQTGVNFVAEQPKEALEKRFGSDLEQRVASCLANQCADKLIAQEGLAAALEPEVIRLPNLESLAQDDAQSVSFSVAIHLKPSLELSSYDAVELPLPKPDVTDAMVDKEIESLAKARSRFVPDEETQIVTEHTVNIVTLDTKKCGMQVAPLTATKMMHQVGDGRLPSEIDEQLLGMSCGDSKEFAFTITSKNFLGLDVEEKMDCTLAVDSIVKKEVPELTDAWVKDNIPGAHNTDSLRALVEHAVGERLGSEYRRVKEESAVSALARRLPDFIVPDTYYDYARAGLLQNVSAALNRQDMTEDEFLIAQGVNASQFMAQMHVRATEILRQGFALDSYAIHEGIEVTDDDRWEALKNIAPGKEDQTRKMLEMNGRTYQLEEMALRAKTRRAVVNEAICA